MDDFYPDAPYAAVRLVHRADRLRAVLGAGIIAAAVAIVVAALVHV